MDHFFLGVPQVSKSLLIFDKAISIRLLFYQLFGDCYIMVKSKLVLEIKLYDPQILG